MPYNETIGSGLVDWFTYGSSVTDGWLGIIIMFSLFIVFFGFMKSTYLSERALPIASFISFVLSFLFYLIKDASGNGFIAEWVVMFFFGLMIFSVLFLFKSNN